MGVRCQQVLRYIGIFVLGLCFGSVFLAHSDLENAAQRVSSSEQDSIVPVQSQVRVSQLQSQLVPPPLILPSTTRTSTQQNLNKNQYQHQYFNSKVQFIFVAGIEGTGHHLMNQIVTRAPDIRELQRLGLHPQQTNKLGELLFRKSGKLTGMFGAHCGAVDINNNRGESDNHNSFKNFTLAHLQVSQTLKGINDVVTAAKINSSKKTINVPVNTLNEQSMMSYPFGVGQCRKLNYPSLGLFYKACNRAKVDCGHVYLFRDPYQVLYSTSKSRHFNKELLPAIHMYRTFLQILSLDMLIYRSRTQGCYGLFANTDWQEPLGKLFGWEQKEDFEELIENIYKPPTSSKSNNSFVPAELSPYMELLEESHQRAIKICLDGRKATVVENE